MGYGSYSYSDRSVRATASAIHTKSTAQIFTQRNINNAMNPYGLKIRESRDSEEHPYSIAIVLGLDETGSMGSVPTYLVKDGFPNLMDRIIKKGVPDPQVMFLGIGDHECDNSPIQVSQFESSDIMLDKWLMDVYLEGKGGGNYGESYLLAWYVAARHTAIDCWEKRKQKGFLFTIGDEPCLKEIPESALKRLFGPEGQYETYTSTRLYDMAREKYNVFHIHIKETSSGGRQEVIDGWKQLLADNLLIAERHTEVADIIAETILKHAPKLKQSANSETIVKTETIVEEETEIL